MKATVLTLVLAIALPAVGAASPVAAAPKAKEKTMVEDEKVAVVRRMIAMWDARDGDGIADMFTEDGVLHSMMIEPIRGRENIRPRMKFLVDNATHMHINVRNIGRVGDVVFLERFDEFTFQGHSGKVPVVGVLEVRDGKVSEWREYYDRKELLEAMGQKADF